MEEGKKGKRQQEGQRTKDKRQKTKDKRKKIKGNRGPDA
jgi:hypothetical protein